MMHWLMIGASRSRATFFVVVSLLAIVLMGFDEITPLMGHYSDKDDGNCTGRDYTELDLSPTEARLVFHVPARDNYRAYEVMKYFLTPDGKIWVFWQNAVEDFTLEAQSIKSSTLRAFVFKKSSDGLIFIGVFQQFFPDEQLSVLNKQSAEEKLSAAKVINTETIKSMEIVGHEGEGKYYKCK